MHLSDRSRVITCDWSFPWSLDGRLEQDVAIVDMDEYTVLSSSSVLLATLSDRSSGQRVLAVW